MEGQSNTQADILCRAFDEVEKGDNMSKYDEMIKNIIKIHEKHGHRKDINDIF